MQNFGYDAWKTDPGEKTPAPVRPCAGCGRDIYVGEEIWEMDVNELVHDDFDCIERYLKNTLNAHQRLAKHEDA